MRLDYIVNFGKDPAGKVQVIRQGLYYCFHCRCQLTGAVMCRLEAVCGAHRENLGVLVPMDGGFGLDTQVPVKRFKGEEFSFQIIPRHHRPEGIFVPISPEEPFAYIARLKDGFLEVKNGQAGVVLAMEK